MAAIATGLGNPPPVVHSSVYNLLYEKMLYLPSQSCGVKGACVLGLHSPFDVCRGVVIDSLHCLYLGVMLKLLKLWFDKGSRAKDFSIRDKVSSPLDF